MIGIKTEKVFPFLKWKKMVTLKNLKADLVAGIVGAVIVLPQGVAFATIAGLPPEYGIYAAIVPTIIAALWGSSFHLVSGPTTAISLVVFSSISPLAEAGTQEYIRMVLTLSFAVGVMQFFMGWIKVGKLLDFISHTVIVGFTAGASILIISSQIKNFFGVNVPQGSSFYETIHIFFSNLENINGYILIVGSATLLSGIFIKKFWPKFPYMVPAMIIGSVVGLILNENIGMAVTGIKTVGALPATLPSLSSPSFDLDILKKIISPALAITILALTEAIAISRSIASRSGQRIDGNQEVIGQGMSNMIGSFFSAYPASGSFNRSGLNYESGAKTPMSSIFAAVFLSIIILFVASLAKFLPVAVMAGILFLVGWGLIDFRHIKYIAKSSRGEISLLAVTFLSTLFLELEFAIFIGVFLSIMLYLKRTVRPLVVCLTPDTKHPNHKFMASCDLPKCEQLEVIKIDGPIFFGSVNNIERDLNNLGEKHPDKKNLLIIFSGVNSIDLSGIDMLIEQAKKYRKRNGDLYLSNANKSILEKLNKYGLINVLGEDHIFESKADAIGEIVGKLNSRKCKKCKSRVFRECAEKIESK